MCLGPKAPEAAPIEQPPEVLEQEAPDKKTANQTDANALSIGTKRYSTANTTPQAASGSAYPNVSGAKY